MVEEDDDGSIGFIDSTVDASIYDVERGERNKTAMR